VKDYLALKYRGARVDLLISLDNTALDMLVSERASLFPGVPAVFGGYNNFIASVISGRPAVTGIAEMEDGEGTIRLALSLFPHMRRALVIAYQTTTGLAARQEIKELEPEFSGRLEFTFLPASTYDEAAEAVALLPKDSFALLLAYSTDREGLSLCIQESTEKLTTLSRVPVFGTVEARLVHGIVGGSLLEGEEHGGRDRPRGSFSHTAARRSSSPRYSTSITSYPRRRRCSRASSERTWSFLFRFPRRLGTSGRIMRRENRRS
jgi:hypothetical protein